jgi:inhibitor of cysteine peptidase
MMNARSFAMLILGLAGVGAAAMGLRGSGEEDMPVFLMSDKGESCIEVRAGENFALRFRTTPGTGYRWEFAAAPDEKLLRFIGEKVEESESGRIGGSVFAVWTFCALAAGEAEISMKYARPWEKGVEPIKTYVFKLTIR